MILFGEGHLRRVIAEYMTHFNHERNHQGIENELIDGPQLSDTGPVECSKRLGGLLKFYQRAG